MKSTLLLTISPLLLCFFLTSFHPQTWQPQPINTTADFRGLSAVSDQVAWVSGTQGTVGRTIDGGKFWQVLQVPGAEKLDFRDIEAFSASTAYLLSIGPGENSRIYKTTDGSQSWTLQFKNPNPDAFFDAIAFWDETHGIALSDPVQGKFLLLETTDGGRTWSAIPGDRMPPALTGEGAFAASGTCLMTQGRNDAWFVTGGAASARVFHSTDRGRSWSVAETPLLAGKNSAGIFSIAFRNHQHGFIAGGDYRQPSDSRATLAQTQDGGKTWSLSEAALPFGSCIAMNGKQLIVVGATGSHISDDDGKHWKRLDAENHNVVSFAKTGTGWATGPKGRIARFSK